MAVDGETWITAVYSNPSGTPEPSNIEENTEIPIFIENNNGSDKIKINYDRSSGIIKFRNYDLIKEIKIFNINGAEIKFINHSINKINLSTLPKGMYILEIITDNYTISRKLVK